MNSPTGEFTEMPKQHLAVARGTVEEVSGTVEVAHLVGTESSYITGTTLTIVGGFSA